MGLKFVVTCASIARHVTHHQLAEKPNKSIPNALWAQIPAFEGLFSGIVTNVAESLPKTRAGNCYILTMTVVVTRYPEAVPLRNIHYTTIVKDLHLFFTKFGLQREIQSD